MNRCVKQKSHLSPLLEEILPFLLQISKIQIFDKEKIIFFVSKKFLNFVSFFDIFNNLSKFF